MNVVTRVKRRTAISTTPKWRPSEEGYALAREHLRDKTRQALRELEAMHPFDARALRAYILLPDHSVRLAQSREEWAMAMEYGTHRVARTEFDDGGYVSTIFLGTDHNYSFIGAPILFESIANIRGATVGETQRRYRTYDEAIAGHHEMVAEISASAEAIKKLTREP
jgi:hypothetical protein